MLLKRAQARVRGRRSSAGRGDLGRGRGSLSRSQLTKRSPSQLALP